MPWFLDRGYWTRRAACKMAAHAMHGMQELFGEQNTQKMCSLTVFFELYMLEGAEGTENDFGPKEPVKLEDARAKKAAGVI